MTDRQQLCISSTMTTGRSGAIFSVRVNFRSVVNLLHAGSVVMDNVPNLSSETILLGEEQSRWNDFRLQLFRIRWRMETIGDTKVDLYRSSGLWNRFRNEYPLFSFNTKMRSPYFGRQFLRLNLEHMQIDEGRIQISAVGVKRRWETSSSFWEKAEEMWKF